MTIVNIINKLKSKKDLDEEDLLMMFKKFETKDITEEEIKALVILWREKGETPFELKILINLIYTKCPQIDLALDSIIDMCGTGGDKSNTFNISTIAAIVSSACSLKVIKHSGRSTTSTTGSVDILTSLGFDIDTLREVKENCLRKTGFMCVSSRLLREIFGDVKLVCKKINSPGFVNLLGPLTNPYKTSFHLLGVSNIKWGELLANILKEEKKDALIVCSKANENMYLDELGFCGTNFVWHVKPGHIEKKTIEPEEFKINFKKTSLNDLIVRDAFDSKTIFENILKGKLTDNDPKVQIVALNSGAALYLAKKADSVSDGYSIAMKNIQSGKGWEHLQNFLNCNKKKPYNS